MDCMMVMLLVIGAVNEDTDATDSGAVYLFNRAANVQLGLKRGFNIRANMMRTIMTSLAMLWQ